MGHQQQPAAYHDPAIDENLRTEHVRSIVHRNRLLAGLFHIPHTDCHVYEEIQLQSRYHIRTAPGSRRRTALFPAAMLKEYWAYLCIFFIIATGMCFLETAANPYVTALGDPKTAPRRLNLAQSFNGLGAFISAMFLSKLILSGTHYTRETLPMDYPGGWQAYIQVETDAMKFPYLVLALLLIAIAVIFVFSKLPKIGDEENKANASGEKLIDFGVLKHSHLRWGVIAQFFYNGGQTAINSLFLVYCCSYAGLEEDTATTFFGLYMLASAGTVDRYRTHGEIPPSGHVGGLCRNQHHIMRGGGNLRRYGRTICHVAHLLLHVHYVSHTVLAGTYRTRQPDQKRFRLSGNVHRRQRMPASADRLLHARK